MEKQKLTKEQMLDRFNNYFGRAITFTMLSALPACVGIPIVLASLILPAVSVEWQVIGWILTAIALGCLVTSVGFSIRSCYWADRAHKSMQLPKWLVADAKWRETRGR